MTKKTDTADTAAADAEKAAAEAAAAAAAAAAASAAASNGDTEGAAAAASAAASAAAAAAEAAERAALAVPASEMMGKVVRLRAVHGDICHAFDGTRFTTDTEVKHEFDAWVKVQFEAGKLKLAD